MTDEQRLRHWIREFWHAFFDACDEVGLQYDPRLVLGSFLRPALLPCEALDDEDRDQMIATAARLMVLRATPRQLEELPGMLHDLTFALRSIPEPWVLRQVLEVIAPEPPARGMPAPN